ncbi:hypothetical protein BRD17_07625 [Halobacteriales archaeon SW_7_68_16]|nr:MAG: hypothetical protein BRD17_07625 [Halobacteriales archaeon SW_7_68_16]
MADEFAKGLGILTGSGLLWMVLAGWYNTPSFEGAQLYGPNPQSPGLYDGIAIIVKEAAFWFAILGALTFWVLIPAGRELRAAMGDSTDD